MEVRFGSIVLIKSRFGAHKAFWSDFATARSLKWLAIVIPISERVDPQTPSADFFDTMGRKQRLCAASQLTEPLCSAELHFRSLCFCNVP
jgi:hypothetical protein